MIEFMKMIKNTSNLNDEDASLIAASKAHDSMPKSRMYYRIEASRNIGGGKKVDPKSNMTDKLKVKNNEPSKTKMTIIFSSESFERCQHWKSIRNKRDRQSYCW